LNSTICGGHVLTDEKHDEGIRIGLGIILACFSPFFWGQYMNDQMTIDHMTFTIINLNVSYAKPSIAAMVRKWGKKSNQSTPNL
jgi:hypothetical protein